MSHVCRAVTFAVFGAAKCEETLFLMALWSLGGWGRNRTADTIPLLEFMIFRRKPRQKTLTNTGAFLNLFLTDFVATVWKHPASPYWSAVFRDEQNVWRKKTTKRRERTKALAPQNPDWVPFTPLSARKSEQNSSHPDVSAHSAIFSRRRLSPAFYERSKACTHKSRSMSNGGR